MKKHMANYFDSMVESMSNLQYPMSFLSDEYNDVREWQEKTRTKVSELLSFEPKSVPMDAKVLDSYVKDGLVYEHISYANPFGPRTEGYLLKPEHISETLPGIVALHDHGGFYYYGKEKITAPKHLPPIMESFQAHYYGSRAWASELAKRGYIVFVPDVFLWGSRKMTVDDIPDEYIDKVVKHPSDSDAYINEYNKSIGQYETVIAKSLIQAGMTWPGITVHDDMRALDFLLSQPMVDAHNIGCGGLSGGGMRTVFLAAMDERIKCSVVAGLMSTASELAAYKVFTHTWMLYIPGLTRLMDFPDLYSMHGLKPTMALYDADDDLFTIKGQQDAHERLSRIYQKMGDENLYRGHFFPGPHKFDIAMQDTAFSFFDEFLKRA